MNPATGPKSTSFIVAGTGGAVGFGTLLSGLLNDPTKITALQAQVNQTRTWVGGAIVAICAAFKLIHDHGLNKATLAAAGQDIDAKLPELRTGIAKTLDFIETEVPGIRNLVNDVNTRVSSVESTVATTAAKIPDEAALLAAAKQSLADLIASRQPAAPAPAPVVEPVIVPAGPIAVTTIPTVAP